jgi:hypothetical protein
VLDKIGSLLPCAVKEFTVTGVNLFFSQLSISYLLDDSYNVEAFKTECKVLYDLRHENLVRYIGITLAPAKVRPCILAPLTPRSR